MEGVSEESGSLYIQQGERQLYGKEEDQTDTWSIVAYLYAFITRLSMYFW